MCVCVCLLAYAKLFASEVWGWAWLVCFVGWIAVECVSDVVVWEWREEAMRCDDGLFWGWVILLGAFEGFCGGGGVEEGGGGGGGLNVNPSMQRSGWCMHGNGVFTYSRWVGRRIVKNSPVC